MAKCARTSRTKSGKRRSLLSRNIPSETPSAIDGTTSGMLTSRSNIEDMNLPAFLRAMIMAVGNPIMMLSTVTIAPKP